MSRNAFHEMFEDRAEASPNAVAVETEGGSVSFADLNRRAGQIATALVEAEVTTGVVVGLFTEPGVDHVAGMLGVGRAGGALLPLPPDLPERRLAGFLDTCDCRTIVVGRENAPALRDRLAAIGREARVIVLGPDTDDRSAPFPAATIGPDDPCYVMFTSGSTGTPKAILGRHKGLSHFLKWEIGEFGLDEATRGSWLAPTTFDVSLRDVLAPLLAGGTVVVPEAETRIRPDRLVDWIAARRLTLVHCVPTVLRLVLRELRERGEARPRFPALRHLLVAGEPLRGEDVAAWRELSGSRAEVVNLYGPSETTLAKLFHRVVDLPDDPRRVLPIGLPLPNTAVLILSNGRLCDPGEIGEIHIRTPYRSLGYLGNPEATAVAFVPNPLSPDKPEVIYKTGDLGRYTPDGLVECLGRRDDQVKINGVRIEPAEIEAALRGLPGVAEAAVAVHPRFDGERELVGYYVRADGSTDPLPVDVLDEELARVLPETMRPRHLMPLAELPTTLSGKINRKALPKPEALFLEGREIVEPVGPTEIKLAGIWAEMFGLSRVGADTTFRELGGDSLRAVRLVMRIHRAFGVDVSLRIFFAGPTVREVARAIDAGASPAVEIPRVADAPDYPVTPAQSRMWRLTRMGVAPTAHNLVDSYRLSGPLNEDALERAFRFLIDRHEPLRTVFRERDGEPRQVIRENMPWSIERIDLRSVPDAEREAERLAVADHDHLFDLETGPLLRVVLIRLPDDNDGERRVMLFNIHHIIGDVWSFNVLARELETAYAALLRGVEPELTALPIRFRDAVAWTTGRLDEAARRHWLDKLSGEIPPLDFPTDRPRPPVRTFNGATERFRLSGADTARLRTTAEARGATTFVTLTALTKALLYRHTGRRDVVVGFPVAGRDHAAMEPLIGCFVDTGVSRDRIDPETPFVDLLAAVGRGIEEARANPYPFDALVDELNLPRDMSRSPLFDALVAAPTRTDVDPALEGVVVSGFGRGNAWNFARYDLVFHFEEDGDELVLDLNFNTDLFDAERIRRCGEQFLELARQVAAAADTPVGRLSILPAAERAAIEVFSRGAAVERPAEATIPGLLASVAARFPDRPALIDANRVLTHAELNRAADHLARRLALEAGVKPGDRVAVLADRSIEGIVALAAITRAGAVYVPIDPEYPEARIARMLDRAEVRLILVDHDTRRPAGDRAVERIRIDTETGVEPFDRARPDDPAYIIFTSGSTGDPKAVEVAHRGFVSMSLGQIETFGLTPEDRTLWFASPSFDASLADIFMGLFSGGAVVVPDHSVIESIPAFLDFIRDTKTTCVTLPPTYLRALDRAEIPGLRILITAGEAATVHSVERAGTIDVFNAYGPTEASVCATIHRVDPNTDGARRIPIGRPLPNTTLRILDEALEPAPIGVTGEIHLGGVGLARGYRGDPETTAARFITHPRDGERLYRTGDLGRFLADGSVDFQGRADEQVKIAGHRIETGEVETALTSLPGVAAAHVATVTRGDGSKALVGWYAIEKRIEPWPSVAEFFVYDDVAYTSMATDEGRNARYRAAFARHLPGKSVIDIGTGPVAILSRLAVEAGADHVTAIDLLESTARKARETVERLGLSDKITVINADASTVALPDRADVCVSEIVGAIGGSEGAAKIINAARRLLKDPSAMLPKRSLTKMAVVNVPAAALEPGFSDIAAHYVERIFAEVGRPFDLRLCLKNLPRSAIVSDDAPFEDLDYTREVPLEATHDVVLTMTRDGPITGFLVWLTLHVDDDQVVDILEHPGSWLPVYLPVFLDGVPAGAGDRIVATVERKLCPNGLNPDFTVTGRLERLDGSKVPFRVDSPHFGGGFRVSPLHARIFADASVPRLEAPTPVTLRRRLSAILPGFAVPTHLIEVEAIPTTVNGKVDRSRLPPPIARATTVRRDADTPIERTILDVWREVLERNDIGLDDDFFALGGDSIRAIQIVSRLRRVDLKAEIRDVFQNPTVARLAGVVVPARPIVDREPVTGRAPTTPIQNWFLRTVITTPNRFVQCAVLRATGGIDPQAARRAVRALWVHHDALRLRLVLDAEGEPEQEFVGTDGDPGFVTIASTADADFGAAVAAARGAFDLSRGPLFTAVLAPGLREDRLALIAHHLVVDAVSWGVLIDDFETAYESAVAGEAPRLPPRTSSYRDHAVAMRRLIDDRDWSASLDRWRDIELPAPTPTKSPAVSTVSTGLDRAETERVLVFGDRGGDARADDVLLAALFVAARRTSGTRRATITVEGHGRDLGAAFGGEPRLDLTRTVGWFTSFTPLSIEVPDDVGRVVATVREARRRLPDEGRSFMLLAHGGPNAPLPASLGRIGFNHLGRLPAGRNGGRFTVDWEAPTPNDEPSGPAIHPLSALTSVVDGRLRIDIDRDPSLVTAAEADALTAAFVDALREIVAGEVEATETSDFGIGDLTAEALDELLGDE